MHRIKQAAAWTILLAFAAAILVIFVASLGLPGVLLIAGTVAAGLLLVWAFTVVIA